MVDLGVFQNIAIGNEFLRPETLVVEEGGTMLPHRLGGTESALNPQSKISPGASEFPPSAVGMRGLLG